MSSCLNINIKLVSLLPSVTISHDSPLEVDIIRCTPTTKIFVSQICSIGVDDSGFEVFMVKEGVFLLSDGQTFKVRKKR